MGTILGKDGALNLANNVIAEVRSFKITIGATAIDASAMGHDGWENHRPGMKNWMVDVTGFYDDDAAGGQRAVDVGDEILTQFFPEGNTTGLMHYNGQAMVESLEIDQNHDGLVEFSMKLKGNGPLAHTAVA